MTSLNLLKRISPEHKADYLARRLTAEYLAATYGVTLNYLWRTLPRGRPQRQQPKYILRQARLEYRISLCSQYPGRSIKSLADFVGCSERTMFRILAIYRERQNG